MANKESFVFYKSWWSAIKDLPNDVRLEILDGINEYALSGILPEFKPMAKLAFSFIKDDLDRSSEKYQNIVERNRENGKNGGRPKTENNPNNPLGILETQEKPNDNDNDNDNLSEDENDNLNDSDIKTNKKKFSFKQSLLDIGADESLITDWLIVRKGKKASNTQHALNLFIKKVESSNLSINEVLSICIDKSWSGFELHWLENIKKNNTQQSHDFILKFEP